MSEAILKLGENGILRQLEKKWFPVSLSNYAPPDDDKNQSLELSDYTYIFVISSCLALLTVLHRWIDAICLCRGRQVVVPEQQESPQASVDVELVVVSNDATVQQLQQDVNNKQVQQEKPLRDGVPEIEEHERVSHEMEDEPLRHAIHNLVQHPLGLQTDGIRPENGSTSLRFRRAASSSNILMPTRLLQSFSSLRPLRVEEIEEQPLRDRTEHNLELQNNDPQPGPSNFSQRYRRTTSSNLSRTTRVLQPFLSLRPQRVQENESQPLRYSVAQEAERQSLHDLANEIEEPGSVLPNNSVEPGISSNLRHRRMNSAN